MASKGDHALVIGGSMAGLLAARVLVEYFDRVTIVDRDHFPTDPAPRKGLPQARHVHLLLARGRDILERLFPGIEAELLAEDAQRLDVIADVRWRNPVGWAMRFRSGITTPACSRDLLDWAIRRRLAAYPQIRFCTASEVTGLRVSADKKTIIGVEIQARTPDATRSAMNADFTVDASGRSSKAPQWLQHLGYAPPAETVITAFIGYASRIYTQPSGVDWRGLLMQPVPPTHLRGGVIYPLEGKRCIVTLSGAGRDYPPTDETGFLAFAHSLRDPLLYDTICDLHPLSPIIGYRATENRLRHYERLTQQPDGFVLLGDSVCAFNPVYGQGMTAAAMGALTLAACLREQQHKHPNSPLTGIGKQFQRRLAAKNSVIWLLATGEDFRYSQTEGGQRTPLTKLAHRYIDLTIRRATHDPQLYTQLAEVIHLRQSPLALASPECIWRTLRPIGRPRL